MRLICPNCGAQYEIDESIIPAKGRDLQCSNCGTTWFEPGKERVANQSIVSAENVEFSEGRINPVQEPGRATTTKAESGLNILREEAEQETRLRAREVDGAEIQPDIVPIQSPEDEQRSQLEDNKIRPRRPKAFQNNSMQYTAQDTMMTASLSPNEYPEDETEDQDSPQDEAVEQKATSRRDLLPDIEEINSTLEPDERSLSDMDMDMDDAELEVLNEAKGSRSARFGFGLVVVLGIITVGLYVLTPNIVGVLPATERFLDSFGMLIDSARLYINTSVDDIVNRLGNAAYSAIQAR